MEFINTLSNNSVIGAFVAGVAVLMCVSLFKWINRRFCKAPKVFKTLEAGLEKHNCKFLPTSYYPPKRITPYQKWKYCAQCTLKL